MLRHAFAAALLALSAACSPAARPPAPPVPVTPATRPHRAGRWWWWVLGGVGLLGALLASVPWLVRSWQTVSTDDAYVNGYVTFVAPRVDGQIARVLVEDNNRVQKGDLLVQLDPEPYQVQVNRDYQDLSRCSI